MTRTDRADAGPRSAAGSPPGSLTRGNPTSGNPTPVRPTGGTQTGSNPAGGNVTAGNPTGGGAHVLDNPVMASLRAAHAHLAEVNGRAARYPADVFLAAALADASDPRAWADLAALAGTTGRSLLVGDPPAPPPDWKVAMRADGVQLIGAGVEPVADSEAVVLGTADVPEMLDLVARTEPGPFAARTIALGTYLGIRRGGALIAMAGERLHPPGWTEISAVCTDPAYRGQGLASRLIRAVALGIWARGETPFLHAAATNTSAIRLYEALGFTIRRPVTFALLESADADADADAGAAAGDDAGVGGGPAPAGPRHG
ncbi:MAG TPA: GNAT family N-acetyltransferase [Rugosimonospora sp.]